MNILKPSKSSVLAIVLAVLGVLLSGCMHLEKNYPDIKTYGLETGSGEHATFTGAAISVRLNAFSVAPQFADRYLTYRTDEIRYESDFYNQLMASPAVMIKDQAQVWLRESPAIEFVLPTDVATNPHYLIDGKVLEFYGDYRKTDQPKAVLKIDFTVSKFGPQGIEILLQRVYPQAISIPGTSPRLLVEGWNQALGKVLSEFEGDLRTLAVKSKSK